MARYELSDRDYQRVWKQHILPDLKMRLAHLEEHKDALRDGMDFLKALLAFTQEIERAREKGEENEMTEHLDWESVVPHLETMTVLAHKRCRER